MKLIVGLGNPGEKYENTRHNIGFKAIDAFIHKHNIDLSKEKFQGLVHKGVFKEVDFVIAKPLTFMNLSGDFVQAAAHFYKIEPQDILVIYDDMDHAVGKAVMKTKGTSGGQNGIKDIMLKLGTEQIPRLKIGIGRPTKAGVDHVLGTFSNKEIEEINPIREIIVTAMEEFLTLGTEKAMLKINTLNKK